PGDAVQGLTFLNTFSGAEFAHQKSSVYDIRAEDGGWRQFHLEMQRLVDGFFPERILYYWSKIHPSRLWAGEEYGTLRPAVSVSILGESLFPDGDWLSEFGVLDVRTGKRFSRNLQIFVIELPKFDVPVELLSTPLERWCYFLKHGASLDPDALPATLDTPPIREAMEIMRMLSRDQVEYQQYLDRHFAELAENTARASKRREDERLRRLAEAVRQQEEDIRRLAETVHQQEEGLRRQQEDIRRQQEGLRRQQEDIRRQQEDIRRQQADFRQKEDSVRQKEDSVRQKEDSVRQKEEQLDRAVAESQTQGASRGEAMGQISLLQRLLKVPQTPQAELAALPIDELRQRLAALESQLAGS
ncbi:MAG: PD-(D/E)XK nuclease family transposase, partial [Gemmataceae bacterium]|nr:PD-(D/E)XK nuclease family transposase [Gemmataceae bacterium]